MTDILHNVTDLRYGLVGSWETEPLVYADLKESDIGRNIIYNNTQAGTLSSWRGGVVFVKYTTGSTAAATRPELLVFGVNRLDIGEIVSLRDLLPDQSKGGRK